ncbi:hypothetical protein ACGFX8_16525 [Streptomyces sp. NPDC048362]|uniref:hypothetical protein n=1 Tax=Streptomyces sp. NPDC048362 TaxID=3365539 RepID=UPI003720DA58
MNGDDPTTRKAEMWMPAGPTPSEFEARFGAVLRAGGADPDPDPDFGRDAERRAMAAFRAARDAGAHRTPTRRRARDDWRP